jgi:hypothetical protein
MNKLKKKFIEEFEAYLVLDKNKLDTIVSTQSSLMHKVGKECAKAVGEAATQKGHLKRVEAMLSGVHRKKLEKIGRTTEKQVEHCMLLDERRITAFEKYNDSIIFADIMESLKDSFKTRGFMIRDMVAMMLASYYAKDSFENSEEVKNHKYEKVRERRKLS